MRTRQGEEPEHPILRGARVWAERVDSGEDDRIALHGEIDLSNVDALGDELDRLLSETHFDRVIIDLSVIDYMDSQGVAMLLKLAQRLEQRDIQLRLVAPPNSVVGELLSHSPLGELPIDRGLR